MLNIVRPLLRHPAMPLLLLVQVALACSIACNTLFLLQQKLAPLMADDGIGAPGKLIVVTDLSAHGKSWSPARLLAAEAGLRQLPGVAEVSYAATLPMSEQGQMLADVQVPQKSGDTSTSVYVGDDLLKALDLHLVSGRDFTALEKHTTLNSGMGFFTSGPTIITQALANHLFPDGNALGQTLTFQYATETSRTIVGVVGHLMRNQLEGDNRADLDYSMLLPGVPQQWPTPQFAIRARDHADVPRLRKSIKPVLFRELGDKFLVGTTPSVEMFTALRLRMLAPTTAAVWLFSGITLIVLIVTLVGIMGMTSYWVRQRTRQIGIRRALGASRRDIFHSFQVENFLVVGAGTILGMVMACAISGWLMQHYTMPRLPLAYLPFGAALLLALGQIAALLPARRATLVPPVAAIHAA